MKSMTLFGKVSFWLGIVFLILGIYLFIAGERLIPLLTFGVCFLLVSQLYRKNENDSNHHSM
ncbi:MULTISPECIES: hypothetical protein [Bacillus]|uniref:Uncharacterized protein n=1 Tax=Bacillus xiamenensis TaxID=1178537 RepID=A0ABT4F5J4_9BACI|nr:MULTISPECIES: hypothetical protein [Bacillus]EKF34964.1 hypothetical protein BA1_12619 [Bacillus xiamenensis]MBG9912352.1 hypothetical protein [Bacillus xiamenensis]MCW1836323.1 hypothetical protein [Bacillus xiamenensis]MCY9576133.1 hypothetical protein [Bacillus xiamenensis]QGX66372.1 hypothetical protein GPA07_13255 [Bacillus sp. ms-22]